MHRVNRWELSPVLSKTSAGAGTEVTNVRLFRYEAPELAEKRVLRPATQKVLRGRFDRQVTAIVAGAGFGKTTSIVQAFEENRLAALGTDRWLACEPDDADAQHLAVGIATVLGVDPNQSLDRLTTAVIEACAGLAPLHVALTLDDVHVIPPGSTGADLLDELLARLAANTHLVLIGRSVPPASLARLSLTNQCVTIGEADLALDAAQVDAFARSVGDDGTTLGDFDTHAGWPALVQLSLQHGRPAQFVWEEVVGLLDEHEQTVLRALVAVEEADAEILSAITGIDDLTAIESIPLVHRRGDRFRAHDLWHELLAGAEEAADYPSRAAREQLDRGRHRDALELCLRTAERTGQVLNVELAEALRDCLVQNAPPTGDDLRSWYRRLPNDFNDEPIADLLFGLVLRLDSPLGAGCDDALTSAVDGFMDRNDGSAAVAALSALAFARTVRRDPAKVLETFATLQQLADAGVRAASPYPLIAQTMLATFSEDFPTVLAVTDELLALELPAEAKGVGLMMRANALNKLGFDALATARAGDALELQMPGIRAILLASSWQAGLITPFIDTAPDLSRGDRDTYVAGIWYVCTAAAIGDEASAVRLLEVIEARPDEAGLLTQPESLWFAQAAVAVLQDRNDDARAALSLVVERFPPEGRAAAAYVRSLALVYQQLPELRPYLEDQPDLGPLYQRDLALNRVHRRLVEVGDVDGLDRLEFPHQAGALLPALGARAATELLSAAWERDHERADLLVAGLLELLGEHARRAFHQAAEHAHPLVSHGAKSILGSIPLAPDETVGVSLLGGTELLIGGNIVENPDWRRERVRALLTFLVLHPDTTRENVMAALWPDAGTTAARRNLRSTLNVLNAVLEPQRVAGDAPFFVRSTGQRLRLVSDPSFEVDVTRFEQALSDAQECVEAGVPSMSIEPLREAALWYRGDLLPDSYDDWVVFARDRLRSRYVQAAVRCAELLVATGRSGEAIDIIAPVLGVEPWSEAAHRALIAAHLEAGDPASARRALTSCQNALVDFGGPAEESTLILERRLSQQF